MKKYILENFVSSKKLVVLDEEEIEKIIIEEEDDNKEKVNMIFKGKVKTVYSTMNSVYVDLGGGCIGYLKIDKNNKYIQGESVMVQVSKEELGLKKSKLNDEISIRGTYLVYIPSNTRLTFSSKINDTREKERLHKIMRNISKDDLGFIVRTNAQGCTEEELLEEVNYLKKKYREICEKYNSMKGEGCIYKPNSQIFEYIKDNLNDKVESIIYSVYYEDKDSEKFDSEIRKIVRDINPGFLEKIYREENADVFEIYGINYSMRRYIARNVSLDCGGSLMIDNTEAMTVIDVNSGRFTDHSNYESGIFKVNMEAAGEIVDQIIKRDIGGIIIVDFIDMKGDYNKAKIISELKSGFEIEGRRTIVHGFTKLGLMEISRMRKNGRLESYFFRNLVHRSTSPKNFIDIVEREIIYERFHRGKKEYNLNFEAERHQVFDFDRKKMEKLAKKYQIKIKYKNILNESNEIFK
ncbi:ribonuclease E/G [Peptostreptococcus canis]|uniref:RNA-binding protein AU-1/Ribonuclease E/G domain-containing protein n=1 Tax=Peptostreptococcus canis TaxID=1159213 RepID=A0ABR6TKZ0_9FIRM|nr:ribonuclease E/G [Peptostreptococcus canis]MBC2576077.1 hypothetical protein [Peptostreptococcus canis]MBP1997797.1 ribonuclease G [Peptostreptococcus canis]